MKAKRVTLDIWIPFIPIPGRWDDRMVNYVCYGSFDGFRRWFPTVFQYLYIRSKWFRDQVARGMDTRASIAEIRGNENKAIPALDEFWGKSCEEDSDLN